MSLRKILVVDDEPDLREIIAFDFERAGFSVIIAENGTAALALIEKEKVDAIVSDIRMPRGDGIQLLKGIRERYKEDIPPMIFITGFSDMTQEEAYDLGIDGIFMKPFDRHALIHCVTKLLTPAFDRWKTKKSAAPSTKETFLVVLPSLEKALADRQIAIGRGGMFIFKNENFPMLGEELYFRFEFEDNPLLPIEGEGIVRWIRPQIKGDLQAGIGIEFLSLSSSSLEFVRELLARLKTTPFIPRG